MKIPSFFMGKIIVTLFPFTDIPSGMKPSAAMFSALQRHPGSALFLRKVPKMPCFCGFYGVGSNEPIDEPSGFKRGGKIKLYQCRSYYAQRRSQCGIFFIAFPASITAENEKEDAEPSSPHPLSAFLTFRCRRTCSPCLRRPSGYQRLRLPCSRRGRQYPFRGILQRCLHRPMLRELS